MKLTPLHIQLMLHYYTRSTPYAEHEPDHAYSDAVTEYRKWLFKNGMLEIYGSHFKVTDKGKCWIDAICSVPLPVSVTTWEISK